VLYDLERNHLSGWWIGDTARQRTDRKYWYWELGRDHLLPLERSTSELTLAGQDSDTQIEPLMQGQFPTELDRLDHIPNGLRFTQRMVFDTQKLRAADGPKRAPGKAKPQVESPTESNAEENPSDDAARAKGLQLHVEQTFEVLSGRPSGDVAVDGGFERTIDISGLEPAHTPRWRLLTWSSPPEQLELGPDSRELRFTGPLGPCHLKIDAPPGVTIEITDSGPVVDLPVSADGIAACRVRYRSEAAVDRFPLHTVEGAAPDPVPMEVVPGFDVTLLGLSQSIMPTAMAWRDNGDLMIASLKGRVWLARDTNHDSVEDELHQFSDDLAAPYGIAVTRDEAGNEAVDVIHKSALVRLWDRDGDLRADESRVVASGWGHTADYHDWAVGLPRDAQGNYYVALPCQQDDRSVEAAYLRGMALRLVPRTPTEDDPRLFAIDPFCAGLRFPMGIALNRSSELFTSDNQGNFNPFNELNHLVRGARYGFINKLDRKPGFRPPSRPPAINIPHPWTRSVNGLAFLDTPEALLEERGDGVFGPFEGHLIGCEFNERGLVRMSLEKVEGQYQGAVYPFSRMPSASPDGFLGPLSCAVSPSGDLYVGNILDSGWGGGNNTGSLVRVRPTGNWYPGIAEVSARSDGFAIRFTTEVDAQQALDPASYDLICYRRISTPDYGGEDVDRQSVKIQQVDLAPSSDSDSDDQPGSKGVAGKNPTQTREVWLRVNPLLEGFVYELRVKGITPGGKPLHPALAHYTLHRIPPKD
jgi:hypothetical protein